MVSLKIILGNLEALLGSVVHGLIWWFGVDISHQRIEVLWNSHSELSAGKDNPPLIKLSICRVHHTPWSPQGSNSTNAHQVFGHDTSTALASCIQPCRGFKKLLLPIFARFHPTQPCSCQKSYEYQIHMNIFIQMQFRILYCSRCIMFIISVRNALYFIN